MISRIDKFPVEDEIGHGGMGRVYRAYDPDVKRQVAIKVLIGESEPELLRRFWAEIDIIGNLQHKNIVTLFGGGEDSGVPYLVMELLPGRTLDNIIKNKIDLSLLEKVRIMSQVAEGLAYAHSKGVIHRDIKPSNIMVLPDGLVKILDFGIARVTSRATMFTQVGWNPGTPSYMAPEQFGPAKTDAQGDIFSFGVVYYELLAYTHPFWVPNDLDATVRRIKTYEPESVGLAAPGCPEALELLVHRAIAKHREIRYADFAELLLDSEAILADLQHERAVAILAEVPLLIESGDYPGAESKLAQARELAPGNREARELSEKVRAKIFEDRLNRRAASLLAESQSQIEQRQFAEAVATLESALQLKRNDRQVRQKLAEANQLLDAHLEANKLVAEARRHQQKDQLPDALSRLQEALKFDPRHSDAPVLLRRVQGELERRDKEARIQRAVEIAAEARGQKRFDDALDALQEVAKQDTSGQVSKLRAQIDSEKAEELRRQRTDEFNRGIAKVRQAIQARDLGDAARQLDFLDRDFRAEPGASELLPQLQAELNAHLRAEEIAAYSRQVRDLLVRKSLGEALDLSDQGLQRFPEDAGLLRLRDEIEEKLAAQRRAETIAAVLKEARGLLESGRPVEAGDALNRGRQRTGDDPAFAELEHEITADLQRQQYAAGLRDLLRRAGELAGADRFDEAITAIETAPAYRNEAEIEALLASLRSAAGLARERRIAGSALESSAALVERGAKQRALAVLDEAVREYPHNPTLSRAAAELRRGIEDEAHQARVDQTRAAIERTIQQRDWGRAQAALEQARRDFPGEPVFNELAEQVNRALFYENLAHVEGEIREKLAENKLAEASEQMSVTRVLFSGEPRWKALEQEIEGRKAYDAALAYAAGLRNRGELDKAEASLRALLSAGAPDDRAAHMLADVQNDRRLMADSLRREVEASIGRGDWKSAEAALRRAEIDAPNAPVFRELATRLEQARFESNLAKTIAAIRENLAANRLAEVSDQMAAGRAIYSRDQRWKTLERDVAQRKTYEAGIEEAAELEKRRDLDAAELLLVKLLRESVPDDRAQNMLRTVRLEKGLGEARDLRDGGDLERAQQRLTVLQREAAPDARVTQLLSEIRGRRLLEATDLIAQGDFETGIHLMENLTATAPPDWVPTIQAAREDAEKRRSAEIERVATSIRQAIGRDDLAAATSELAAAESRFPSARNEWSKLKGEIQSRAGFLQALHKAGEARQCGNYAEGIRILSALRPAEPADHARIVALRQAIEDDQQARARADAIQAAKKRADRLQKGDVRKLIAFLDQSRRSFPEEASFEDEYNRAVARLEQTKARAVPRVVEPKPQASAPSTPVRRRTVGIAIGAGLLSAAGIAVYWYETSRPPESPKREPVVAQVHISSEPRGASVRLNNRTCTTPCVIEAPAGTYPLNARLDGYEPTDQNLVVGVPELRNGADVRLTLKPVPPPPPAPEVSGTVEVATNQDDTIIHVDGQRYGLATLRKPVTAALRPGEHRIQAEKPNYSSADQRVRIEAGRTKEIVLDLHPLPGRLSIVGALPDTQIAVDGVVKGRTSATGALTAGVNPGQHRVQLSRDGYSPREQAFELEPNQTITLGPGHVELTRIPAPAPDRADLARQALGRVPTDPDKLEAFAAQYDGTPAAAEARQRAGQLRAQAQRDQLAREQAAKEQTAREQAAREQTAKTQVAQTRPTEDAVLRQQKELADQQRSIREQGVKVALDEFNAAFQHRSARDLKRVWPTAPRDYLDSVQSTRGVSLRVIGPVLSTAAGTASVECELVTRNTVRVKATLQQSGDRWLIVGFSGI